MKTYSIKMMSLILSSVSFFAGSQAFAGSELKAVCHSTDGHDIAACVYQEPWGDTASQYVIRWSKGTTDCNASPSSSHQFIGDDIKNVDDDGMKLKETSNILGVFCRNKRIFKMDANTGKATFLVKNSGCNFHIFGDGPDFDVPKSKLKTKMQCAVIK